MKRLIIIAIIILSVLGYLIYDSLSYYNVIVKFDDLEPFEKPMNVYFKGFKIGKTVKIYPNEDYTNTYLKLKLNAPQTKFPSNITAKIRKKKTGGYVDILFPSEPCLKPLKHNDEISGFIAKDISSLLEGENVQDIVEETESLVESANSAINNLNGIFIEIRKILVDNRASIDLAINNFAKTSTNFENISAKLNESLDSNSLENSVENISQTTYNIKELSNNLKNISSQVDSVTLPVINATLCETNSTVKNAKEITGGIKRTLRKRLGLSRILFGRPISDNCE